MGIDFESSLTYSDLLLAYRITLFSIWGVGVDIPRLLVRYAKSYPTIINLHTISMMICSLLTLMYVLTRTILYYQTDFKNKIYLQGAEKGEFVLSWVLVGFILVQIILGFKVRYEMVSQKLSTDMFTIKIIHRWVGISMSLLGKIIVALLIYPLQGSGSLLFKSWLFLVGTLLFIFIILEIIYRIQTRSLMLKFPLKHESKFSKLHS